MCARARMEHQPADSANQCTPDPIVYLFLVGTSIIAFSALALLKPLAIWVSFNPDTIDSALDLDTPMETILVTRSSTLRLGILFTLI